MCHYFPRSKIILPSNYKTDSMEFSWDFFSLSAHSQRLGCRAKNCPPNVCTKKVRETLIHPCCTPRPSLREHCMGIRS